ncbi:Hsp70 family chaperone, partial [Metarhizium majus ARSEF 297]
MHSTRQTDVCIAIDFGTTFTGVAWMVPTGPDSSIRVLPGDPITQKFPTILAKHEPGKWGSDCQNMYEEDKWRAFKIYLDQAQLRKAHECGVSWAPDSADRALKIAKDYLGHLHDHICRHLPASASTIDQLEINPFSHKSWGNCKIDFIFSVPTTWDWGQRAAFRDIVKEAGFGRERNHQIILGLTEAEAASVYALCMCKDGSFNKNDTILSIDMGGGTTDIAFVDVEALDPHKIKLVQQVKGVDSGSKWIDKDFERFVADELGGSKNAQLKRISREMSQGNPFQHEKLRLGFPEQLNMLEIPIPRNGLRNIHGSNGEKTTITLPRRELERFFDSQVNKIAMCTDDALNNFWDSVQKQVDHVILSGGLGGSKYMLTELKDWISKKGPRWVNGATVHVCPNPQLAVVYGLLMNQRQNVLQTRIARVNIGVVEKEHNEKLPDGTEIHWLLRRGQKRTTGQEFSKTFVKSIDYKGNKLWNVEVFRSDNDSRYLPNTTGDGVESIGVLSVESTGRLRKRSMFRTTKVPYKVNLHIDAVGDYRVEISGDHVNSSTHLHPIQE